MAVTQGMDTPCHCSLQHALRCRVAWSTGGLLGELPQERRGAFATPRRGRGPLVLPPDLSRRSGIARGWGGEVWQGRVVSIGNRRQGGCIAMCGLCDFGRWILCSVTFYRSGEFRMARRWCKCCQLLQRPENVHHGDVSDFRSTGPLLTGGNCSSQQSRCVARARACAQSSKALEQQDTH